jgi:endonuclease/exonuclease/phosphatase family metal-dependent hydrolase
MERLPDLVGGHFHWEPLPGRTHGLGAWSPHPLPRPQVLPLPVSRMPGRLPPRFAQILQIGDITIANVHLSHGQLLNRWQLLRIIRTVEGPAAVIGDYNAIGPTLLPGFRDVGPREPTLVAQSVLRFRLDRCLIRGLDCDKARALERGPSDHRPIAIELAAEGHRSPRNTRGGRKMRLKSLASRITANRVLVGREGPRMHKSHRRPDLLA